MGEFIPNLNRTYAYVHNVFISILCVTFVRTFNWLYKTVLLQVSHTKPADVSTRRTAGTDFFFSKGRIQNFKGVIKLHTEKRNYFNFVLNMI